MKVERISDDPVLVGSDYKRAYLFFDKMVPIIWPGAPSNTDLAFAQAQYGTFQETINTPYLKAELLHSRWREYIEIFAHLTTARLVCLKMRDDYPDASNRQLGEMAFNYLKKTLSGGSQNYVLVLFPNADVLWSRVMQNHPLDALVEELRREGVGVDTYGYAGSESTDDSVDVMLANVNIIQCEDLTWEQIGEIRKDTEALNDLRRLRKFVFREMKGFPKSYVEDELLKAMEDHHKAAKKWSISTRPSNINFDCEAGIVGGIVLAAFGIASGVGLTVAAGVGAAVPLAQAMITLAKGKKAAIKNSNVRYLIRLQAEASRKT